MKTTIKATVLFIAICISSFIASAQTNKFYGIVQGYNVECVVHYNNGKVSGVIKDGFNTIKYNGNYNTTNGNSTGKVNMVNGKQSNYSASITENKCVFTIYAANGNYTFNLSKNKPQQKSSPDDYVNDYHKNYHSTQNYYYDWRAGYY